MLKIILIFALGLTAVRAEDTHAKTPQPRHIARGAEVSLSDYLVPGKTTIFDFYSEYCPDCKALEPSLDALHRDRGDLVVVKVDINRPEVRGEIDWKSPVALQYGVDYTPRFTIYGPDGKLQSEGKPAAKIVKGWIGS